MRVHSLVLVALIAASIPVAAQTVKVTHLYNLSNFSGTVPLSWVNFVVDRQFDEVLVDGS